MENNYNKNNLYIAGLRWFSKENNGLELGDNLSYGLLWSDGDNYYNLFDTSESFPVFERSRTYSNCTSDGVEYGTKMIHKSGELETGPCWLIISEFPSKDEEVSLKDMEKFILKDKRYFKDREKIVSKYMGNNPIKMAAILYKDSIHRSKMYDEYSDYYFGSQKQKVKKN